MTATTNHVARLPVSHFIFRGRPEGILHAEGCSRSETLFVHSGSSQVAWRHRRRRFMRFHERQPKCPIDGGGP